MVRESETQRLAMVITKSLASLPYVRLKADEGKVTARIGHILTENFAQETALREEAEQLATSHARQILGMDRERIVHGIMERLARERNFPL